MFRGSAVALSWAARKGGGYGQAGAVRPLAAAIASLQLGPLAPAATAMRAAWSSAPISSVISSGQRGMSYFSGSHYDQEHMREAKNPDLPEDEGAADAAVRIFGTSPVSNPHQRSIRKLLNAPLKGEAMARWYPPELIHNVHGYQDPFVLRRQAQLSRLRRRGKGPPKKGQGKRSKKK